MSLARSLLQAWQDPLVDLSNSANSLLHPSQSSISNKIRELQEHSKSLGDGLDILSGKVSKCGKTNHQSNTDLLLHWFKMLLWNMFLKQLFIHSLSRSLYLPPLCSRWVQQLRPSPHCPTEGPMTSARTTFPNWPTSISCCPASAATLTRLTASWKSSAAGLQKCNPKCAK